MIAQGVRTMEEARAVIVRRRLQPTPERGVFRWTCPGAPACPHEYHRVSGTPNPSIHRIFLYLRGQRGGLTRAYEPWEEARQT